MIALTVKYTGAVPGIAQRRLPAIKKAAYEAAGIDWHAKARPKHFTRAGASEYGYSPRKGEAGNRDRYGFARSYTGRKLAKFGHTLPLVYSGQSQTLTRMRDVRATSRGCRVVLRSPGFNRRNRFSKIDMRAELTAVSVADRRSAEQTIDATMEQQIRQIADTETKTF